MARKKTVKDKLADSITKKIKEAESEINGLDDDNKEQKKKMMTKEDFENKVKSDVDRANGEKQPKEEVKKEEVKKDVKKEEKKEGKEETLNTDYILNNTEFDDDEANWVPDTLDEEELDKKKYLTGEELARLNFFAERHRTYAKDSEILNLKRQIITEKQKTLNAQQELEKRNLTIIDFQMREYRIIHEAFKQENKEFLKGLSEKNEIESDGKWGYDPESGEIIIDVE